MGLGEGLGLVDWDSWKKHGLGPTFYVCGFLIPLLTLV